MKERKVKTQNNSDNVISPGTDLDTIEPCGTYTFDEKLRSVAGTLQLEGMTFTQETQDIILKYVNKECTYDEIVEMLKEKWSVKY